MDTGLQYTQERDATWTTVHTHKKLQNKKALPMTVSSQGALGLSQKAKDQSLQKHHPYIQQVINTHARCAYVIYHGGVR
jgi:hypothetical protein